MVLIHLDRKFETRFHIRNLERFAEDIRIVRIDARKRVIEDRKLAVKYNGARMQAAKLDDIPLMKLFKKMRELNIVTGRSSFYGPERGLEYEITSTLKAM